MNLEKVITLVNMVLSVTKALDEITKSNYDLRGLCIKLNPLISIGNNIHLQLTRSEEEKYFIDNEGKTDLCDAWNFYEKNRHGIDSAFDANPEEVTELISNADIEIKKSVLKIKSILDAVRKTNGNKGSVFLLLNSLWARLNGFTEVFKGYLKDNDPRLEMIKPFFIDGNKARTFLNSIEINPQKDSVLGKYKQSGFIKAGKFQALLRVCEELGFISNHKAISQKIKRTRY